MAIVIPENELGLGRQNILRILRKHRGVPLSPQEILRELPGMTYGNLRLTIKRMYQDGQIEKVARGAYTVK